MAAVCQRQRYSGGNETSLAARSLADLIRCGDDLNLGGDEIAISTTEAAEDSNSLATTEGILAKEGGLAVLMLSAVMLPSISGDVGDDT